MIKEPSFLLGTAFSLLTQARGHMIRKEDLDGVELIESQYQELQAAIEALYYKPLMEKKDGSGK
jgi:hypothetical protein